MGVISSLLTTNPAFLIIWLVILSLNIGAVMGISTGIWITYTVVLLFTGGIIVLFRYIVTLASNLKVLFERFSGLVLRAWAVVLLVLIYPGHQFSRNINLSNLFLFTNLNLLGVLTVYLLFVLSTVVKLATSQKGPLKSFFKHETL